MGILRTTLAICRHYSQENHICTYLRTKTDWQSCAVPDRMLTSMSRSTFSDSSLCALRVIATLERQFLPHMHRSAGNSCLQRRAPKIKDLAGPWRGGVGVNAYSDPSLCRKRLAPPAKFVCSDLLRSPVREYIVLERNPLVCGVSPSLAAHLYHD